MKKGLSPKISVYLSDVYSKKLKLKPNHLVSGLVHKNKKMLFDSTSSFNNMFADSLGFIQDKKIRGRVVAENVTGTKFNFVNDAYDNKLLATDIYEQFMDLESIKDSSEIFDDGGWFYLAMLLTNAGVAYINYKNGVVKFDREAFVKSPICQEYLELY